MGAIFKKTATKPLPAGAEIVVRQGQRLARWRNRRGRMQTAPVTTGVDGSVRIVLEAATFTAKFRDGSGRVVEKATGCRDESAARRVLAELERRAELVRAGVVTAEEDSLADSQHVPLSEHIAAYIVHQTAKGVHPDRVKSARQRLERVAADCRFTRLSDLNPDKLVGWLQVQAGKKMSAGARNGYREAWIGFANWCVRSKPRRLMENPFTCIPKADAKSDCRRKRRALNEDELHRLLEVATARPLQEAMTVRRGKRKGQTFARLRDETRARLAMLGRERALI